MTDIVSDGAPFETPISSATEGYAATAPSFGGALGAMFRESSTTGYINRAHERAMAADPRQAEMEQYAAAGMMPDTATLERLQQAPAPIPMAPDQYNEKYAPMGADGKRVLIGDKPMPEAVAQLIGKAKADEIQRESVIGRFSAAHSFATTFGTGMAAFMLDPMNAASMFLPGIGEEAVLGGAARAGLEASSIAARTAARAVSGASAGISGQAPLVALRYGLGQQEASDYSLRDAFRDMAFGAAGGAIFHAGIFGGLREAGILAPDRIMLRGKAGQDIPPEAADAASDILRARATTQADAMRGAVSQVVDGREVGIDHVLDASEAGRDGPSRSTIADIAEEQRQVYRNGYAPGIPTEELAAASEAMYTPLETKGNAETGGKVDRIAELEGQRGAEARGEPVAGSPSRPFSAIAEGEAETGKTGTDKTPESSAPLTQTDVAIADAEQGLAGQVVHPEDAAEIAAASGEIDAATARGEAYQEAAACLVASGEV